MHRGGGERHSQRLGVGRELPAQGTLPGATRRWRAACRHANAQLPRKAERLFGRTHLREDVGAAWPFPRSRLPPPEAVGAWVVEFVTWYKGTYCRRARRFINSASAAAAKTATYWPNATPSTAPPGPSALHEGRVGPLTGNRPPAFCSTPASPTCAKTPNRSRSSNDSRDLSPSSAPKHRGRPKAPYPYADPRLASTRHRVRLQAHPNGAACRAPPGSLPAAFRSSSKAKRGHD